MEGYRSYPEGRPPYGDGLPAEPEYAEGGSWYGERAPREPDRYEPDRYDERTYREPPERYDEPRREPPRPSPSDSGRVAAGAPRPAPPPDDPPPAPAPTPRRAPAPAPPPPTAAAAPGSPGPAGDGVYRSRRPGTAVLIGLPAAVLELPALLLLSDAAFADPVSPSGVIAAACLILALPLGALGLYAVATGAVRAAGPNSIQAWLRPPVAYLTVALALFIAAGFAA